MSRKRALQFVILIGVASLFGDMTYEGARSITGQFLETLGASGAAVAVIAGFGEFVGYGLRPLFGYLSDRIGKYWFTILFGYTINVLAVPLLAFAGNWELAAFLIIMERFGKAIRSPSKDALLSYASKELGRGFTFGLHEALDQTGAILGPLIVSLALYTGGSYNFSFGILLIPALLTLSILILTRFLYPRPHEMEEDTPQITDTTLNKKYWLYIAAISFVAAAYIDFPLIAFHLKTNNVMSDAAIPILFSAAMGSAGISALIFGRLYDKKGLSVLIIATALTSFFAPLVFIDSFYAVLAGMILWGAGLGSQESIMRAYVANLVPKNKRATAYGVFNAWFGIFWFLGSAFMGFLYDFSITAIIAFSLAAQLTALSLFTQVKNLKT